MELASYLAGERWSDHPACTHPLLAAVARDVNDYTSDAGRARLAGLIPSVIGLAGDDLHLDARIALGCARTALPVVAAGRQQVMAVSVLTCEHVLAALAGRPTGWRSRASGRWRKFRTQRGGPAASPATSLSPRRPFAAAARLTWSTPRWRGSRKRASRSQMRSSVNCSSARSASAPHRPARTPGRHSEASGRPHAHGHSHRPLTRMPHASAGTGFQF
jgi:hypothetical protein